MKDWATRKAERIEASRKLQKMNICTACNGSGYYDNNGSPVCSCCNGSGKK